MGVLIEKRRENEVYNPRKGREIRHFESLSINTRRKSHH